jgi:hypothetical protein
MIPTSKIDIISSSVISLVRFYQYGAIFSNIILNSMIKKLASKITVL